MKQLKMNFLNDYKKEFGGSLLVGKRKTARPLSHKLPIHLVLKSCHKGIFNPGNRSLEKLIKLQAQKFDIKVYDFALNWSHIHMVIKLKCKEDYIKFIRSLTSVLAQRVREFYLKNKSAQNLKKIFSLRPYTRILTWGRQFKNALNYQILNQLEALNLIVRPKRKLRRGVRPKRSLYRKFREFRRASSRKLAVNFLAAEDLDIVVLAGGHGNATTS